MNARITVRQGLGVWYWTAEIYETKRDHVYTGYTNTKWGAKRAAKRALRRYRKAYE